MHSCDSSSCLTTRPLRRPRRAAAADIFETPPPPIFVCRRAAAAAAENLSARRRRHADMLNCGWHIDRLFIYGQGLISEMLMIQLTESESCPYNNIQSVRLFYISLKTVELIMLSHGARIPDS